MFRKAKALYEMPEQEGSTEECRKMLERALQNEPDNAEIKQMLSEIENELKGDAHVPVAVEKERFDRLFQVMKDSGGKFEKLKIRYFGPDYRGLIATKDLKCGEIACFMPLRNMITLEMACASPIGHKMCLKNLKLRLISPKHSLMATFVLQEVRKPDSIWLPYFDVFPKNFDNFPIFYT